LCGEGLEHRKRWIEDRLQTFSERFAASVCGFAVRDNHLHVLVRLEPDSSNGWQAEDIVRRWLVGNESSSQPISARDWLTPSRTRAPGGGLFTTKNTNYAKGVPL
jgi:hypothetical protein